MHAIGCPCSTLLALIGSKLSVCKSLQICEMKYIIRPTQLTQLCYVKIHEMIILYWAKQRQGNTLQIFSNDSLFVANCQHTMVCLLPALSSTSIKSTRMWSVQRICTSSACHGKLQRPLTMKHSTYYYQGDIHRKKACSYIGTCNFSAFNEI